MIREHAASPRPAERPAVFDTRSLLLVEGSDEQRLARRLLGNLNADDVTLVDLRGANTGWRRQLELMSRDGNFRAHVRNIGFIADAETNSDAAFQRCADALIAVGFPAPAAMGDVVVAGELRSGVFVSPGDETLGMLEDLILRACDTVRIDKARAYLTSVASEPEPRPGPNNRSKGLVQAYMAALPDSPKTLAAALRGDLVALDDAAFGPLRSFLRALAM